MDINELMDPKRFAWRLQVLMAMADVRVCELADACSISSTYVSAARSGRILLSDDMRRKLLWTLQTMHPEVFTMLRAAESASAIPLLRSHDVAGGR